MTQFILVILYLNGPVDVENVIINYTVYNSDCTSTPSLKWNFHPSLLWPHSSQYCRFFILAIDGVYQVKNVVLLLCTVAKYIQHMWISPSANCYFHNCSNCDLFPFKIKIIILKFSRNHAALIIRIKKKKKIRYTLYENSTRTPPKGTIKYWSFLVQSNHQYSVKCRRFFSICIDPECWSLVWIELLLRWWIQSWTIFSVHTLRKLSMTSWPQRKKKECWIHRLRRSSKMLPATPVQQRHNKVKVYFHETRITLSHYHIFMDFSVNQHNVTTIVTHHIT